MLLDQFPRNLFRGSPRAFESDAKALEIADAAVAAGFDFEIPEAERCFFYTPMEHAEDLATQDRACALIQRTGDPEFYKFVKIHRDIIARFGRFPHRNAVLGRETTAAEAEFLKSPLPFY